MKRNNFLIFLVVIIVLSIITIAFTGCSGSTGSSTESTQVSRESGGSMESVPKNTIIIKDNAFLPMLLGVKVGDTITWINQDSYDHTVKESNGVFDSGPLAKGAEFSYTFTKEGKYDYSCTIHTFMTGTINVFK
jgi:plastocyanin